MKMDTLFLKTLNPILNLVETKSLFYNKYLYRLKIKAIGMRQHIYYKGDLNKFISNLNYKYRSDNDEHVIHGLNNCLYKIIIKKLYKYRIEHSHISMYTKTEQEILDIIFEIKKAGHEGKIIELSAPKLETVHCLTDNVILVKRIPDRFKIKVTIKGGLGTEEYIESRKNLFNHLFNLKENVYRHNLEAVNKRNNYYFNSTYFYCTDEQTLLLLQLAHSDLIGKTFKVVQV